MSKTPLNATEASEFLRTTKSGLYAMVQRRQIPFIRVGKRRILFFKEDLIEFLEKRVVPAIKTVSPNGDIKYW